MFDMTQAFRVKLGIFNHDIKNKIVKYFLNVKSLFRNWKLSENLILITLSKNCLVLLRQL